MSPLDYAALVAKLAQTELEMVRAFRASADAQFAEERLRLTRVAVEIGESDPYHDHLSDQYVVAEEILELAEELAIVAAYRVVELNAKRLARWVDKSYSHFSWPSFARLVRSKIKIQVDELDGAAAMDELRLLCNAIKHEGKVTDELARYAWWTAGARVHPLGPCFERLSPHVPTFINALGQAVLPVKLGGTRADEDVFAPKGGHKTDQARQ
jgi:hypothetical protein